MLAGRPAFQVYLAAKAARLNSPIVANAETIRDVSFDAKLLATRLVRIEASPFNSRISNAEITPCATIPPL
jgi:hypothetical protein